MKNNPFFDLCTDLSDVKGTVVDVEGSIFGSAYGGMHQPLPEPMNDITREVGCTLVEFYCGAQKQIEYTRQVIGLDGSTVRMDNNCINVFLRPGMKNNHKITLSGLGNQQLKRNPTDLHVVFQLQESEPGTNAALFSRIGDSCDLYYTHKITLADALECKPVSLTTLDGRVLKIAIDSFMAPDTVKCIEGEGLPFFTEDTKELKKQFDLLDPVLTKPSRGNLYILFEVEFPKTLSREQRLEIASIFSA